MVKKILVTDLVNSIIVVVSCRIVGNIFWLKAFRRDLVVLNQKERRDQLVI